MSGYCVRVVMTDEYTDSDDAAASVFYGPFRSPEKARAFANKVVAGVDGAAAQVVALCEPRVRFARAELKQRAD